MASLDASIILQGKPAQIENPLITLAQGEQYRAAQTKNRLLDMQLQDQQRTQASQNALMELTKAAYDPATGTIDPAKIRAGLAQGGNYGALQDFEAKQLTQQKAQRDADKARLESVKQNVELQGQLLGGVTDQASYDAARQYAAENGVDVSKLPPAYDPNMVSQLRARALTASQQVEQEWKQKGYDRDIAQLGESMRHNRAAEANTVRGQDMLAASAQAKLDAKNTPSGKPLPAAALKMQQEALDAIGLSSSINADLGAVGEQLRAGKMSLGPASNLINKGRNFAGISTEESRNFGSFQSTLEKLRNDSLRLNKGVQTEGDAQRAWNELFSNINDQQLVQQRLGEIQRINERAVNLHKMSIDQIRQNYGAAPLDTDGYTNQPAALNGGASGGKGAGGTPKINSKAEMDALPSGTLFIAPDGTTRRKP